MPLERSVFRDDWPFADGRLAPVEAIVDAEFHHVDVLLDIRECVGIVKIASAATDNIFNCSSAETIEVVFEERRPIVPEGPFEADTHDKVRLSEA